MAQVAFYKPKSSRKAVADWSYIPLSMAKYPCIMIFKRDENFSLQKAISTYQRPSMSRKLNPRTHEKVKLITSEKHIYGAFNVFLE